METRQKDLFSQTIESRNFATYLFFDTETTGLPNNWQAPVGDWYDPLRVGHMVRWF